MIKTLSNISFFILISLLSLTLFQSQKVSAAVISPDKYYIDIKPGENKDFELKVLADARQPDPITLYIYPMVMTKVGEEDDREFIVPNENDAAEAANWVKLGLTKATIKAGDIVSVPFSVKVSDIARCGTNLAAIFISTSPREGLNKDATSNSQESEVGIRNSIVSQLHINVAETSSEYCDEVKTRLDLLEFKVDSTFPIYNYDNITFTTRIKNEGNLLSQSPRGYIEMFGTGSKITIPFNEEQLDIYPGTVRKFSNTWVDPDYPVNGTFIEQFIYELSHFRFGQYEARLGVTFNVSPKIVSSVYVWIIPWRIVLVVAIVISIVALLIIRDRRKSIELKSLKKTSKRN
jgi:hypothetical protein